MFRTFCHRLLLLIVTLGLTTPCWAQGDRDRDRDGAGRMETGRDRDRGEDGRDQRGRVRPEDYSEPAPPTFRSHTRERDDQEGTEEGMPQAQMAPSGVPGARFAPPPWRAEWKLGVYAANSDTGVHITRVIPRSAASRAGLERGDRILAIDGYQIGYVNGRLFSLGEELQRRAGRSGRVSLLVHNWRNRDLLNVEVQLDRQR